MFKHYVNQAMEDMDVSNVTHIAMDETSRAGGNKYITLFIDMDTKRLIFTTVGKDAEVLQEFTLFLDSKGVNPSQIKEVCCDISHLLFQEWKLISRMLRLLLINFMW